MEDLSPDELAEIEALIHGPASTASGDVVTAAGLAEWLGLNPPRISALAREGRIPRRADGRYDLKAAVRGYVESLRLKSGSSALAANPELNREKVRLAAANARKVELQNLKTQGELLGAADVERTWAGILRDVRAGVLAAPSRIGSRLPHLSPHDVTEIARELAAVLSELAEGEPHAAD